MLKQDPDAPRGDRFFAQDCYAMHRLEEGRIERNGLAAALNQCLESEGLEPTAS